MPRFVILEHDHPFLHWDLMLEAGDSLRTWRLLGPPNAAVSAEPLPSHRLAYLEYEGPVSGNRGSVRRWDAGTFAVRSESAADLVVHFSGSRVRGDWLLSQSLDQSCTFAPTITASPDSSNGPGCS